MNVNDAWPQLTHGRNRIDKPSNFRGGWRAAQWEGKSEQRVSVMRTERGVRRERNVNL